MENESSSAWSSMSAWDTDLVASSPPTRVFATNRALVSKPKKFASILFFIQPLAPSIVPMNKSRFHISSTGFSVYTASRDLDELISTEHSQFDSLKTEWV